MSETPRWYLLEPEATGGLGKKSVVRHEPILSVDVLDFEFEGWLGDDLVFGYPCYIATTALCDDLRLSGVTGLSFRKLTVSYDEQLLEREPTFRVPPFEWLVVEGRVRRNDETGKVVLSTGLDANLDQRTNLVVSDRMLAVVKRHKLDHGIIEEV